MPRTGSTTLSLPPFEGATRQLVFWNVAIWFTFVILGLALPSTAGLLGRLLMLSPAALLRGEVWQLLTYAFMPVGLLAMVFGMLTLWICGSMLESERGSRWLYELYFVSAIGGAALASAISLTRVFGLALAPGLVLAAGPFAGIFGLLIAIAMYFGDQEFTLMFLIRLKARYMVAIYILIDLAVLLTEAGKFNALVELGGALSGYLLLRFMPRRGLTFALTERFYGMRNEYYKAKRRSAAKKFAVYMGKQGREVHFDKDGKYIDPERDPNDKRWMN